MDEGRIHSGVVGLNAARMAGRIVAALAAIATVTFVFSRLVPVNATSVGFFYLVAILTIAAAWGLVESTLASIVAMLCFNYFFLPPVGTFTIADPLNWVALFAFLATSLTASQLSARAKRRTEEAVDRQRELERLYALSRGLLLTNVSQPIASPILQQITQSFESAGAALYERSSAQVYRAGIEDVPDLDSRMRQVAAQSTASRHPDGLIIAPIRLGGEPLGSLAIRGAALSEAALESLLSLVAVALERARSQEAMNRAEIARRSGELKSTLLDALAHEFKTPLTSIKAATTDLLSEPDGALRLHERELIGIADSGADRLSKLVTDAIQLARIEGGQFRLNRGVHFPSSLVLAALRPMKSLTEDREVKVSVPYDLPPVWVDAELIQMVISHLIDNSLKYSAPGTPITIRACADDHSVTVSVVDCGAGIMENEQTRIFDKFYRGKSEQNLKGSGMGLAIAREIIRAHGEEISVRSKSGEGAEFFFSLPIAPPGGNQ